MQSDLRLCESSVRKSSYIPVNIQLLCIPTANTNCLVHTLPDFSQADTTLHFSSVSSSESE